MSAAAGISYARLMRRAFPYSIAIVGAALLLAGCDFSGSQWPLPLLTEFVLEAEQNPDLAADALGAIGTDYVTVNIPSPIATYSYVPTLAYQGSAIYIDDVLQSGEIGHIDFGFPINIGIESGDRPRKDYVVVVSPEGYTKLAGEVSEATFDTGSNRFKLRVFDGVTLVNQCGGSIVRQSGTGVFSFTSGFDGYVDGSTYAYVIYNDVNDSNTLDSGEYYASTDRAWNAARPIVTDLHFDSWAIY